MNKLFSVLVATFLSISALGQSQGVSLRATNGVAFGRFIVNDHFEATNTTRTNQISGKLIGSGGIATGAGGAALGLNNKAGQYSLITGSGNNSSGSGVIGGGQSNLVSASAANSLVSGRRNIVSGPDNAVSGVDNTIDGDNSSGSGTNIVMSSLADNSHVFGRNINLDGANSNCFVFNADASIFSNTSVSNAVLMNAPGGFWFSGGVIHGDGSGLTGASGSFPLTSDANANGYSITNLNNVKVNGTFTASTLSAGTLTVTNGGTFAGITNTGPYRGSLADGGLPLLVSGTTKGIRFQHTSGLSTIDGVDSTGVASYQPIRLNGSTVTLAISDVAKVNINSSGDVGIGAVPANKLDVAGGAVFGSTAAGSVTAGDGNGYFQGPNLNIGGATGARISYFVNWVSAPGVSVNDVSGTAAASSFHARILTLGGASTDSGSVYMNFNASGPRATFGGTTPLVWNGSANAAGGSLNSGDVGICRASAGVLEINSGTAGSFGYYQWGGEAYLATNVVMSSTTLSNVNFGRVVSVTTGRKYTFKLILYVSDALAVDGVKIDFGGGTATATNFRAHVTVFGNGLAFGGQATSLTGTVGGALLSTDDEMVEVHGSFEPSSTGTFIPRFAKNGDAAGANLTLYRGSHLQVFDTP